jgi:nitrate/TMAO reductase-like tetraheme cytochrome c subunit
MGEVLMRYALSLLAILIIPLIATGGYGDESGKEAGGPAGAVAQAPGGVCIDCHDSDMMKPAFRNIPQQWRTSWHYQNNVACGDCHGGDPKDASMAMSPQRGFAGAPAYAKVPEFCGKCHVGIFKNYLESGHGKALMSSGKGPNCVTCHGAHDIRKASLDIINEQRCSKCHSYERAAMMKKALFIVEKKLRDTDKDLKQLKSAGVFSEEEEKNLFSTEAEFRTLFHSVNVSLIKERTDEFTGKLNKLDAGIQKTFDELRFRKNFSTFIMLLFIGMGIVFFLLSKGLK